MLHLNVDPNKCTGCLICVLRCSIKSEGIFSPAAAKIRVIPYSDEKVNEISFTEECDTCGLCVHYCPHGALYRDKNSGGAEWK